MTTVGTGLNPTLKIKLEIRFNKGSDVDRSFEIIVD
jgi:hypothetical protein